MSNIYIGTKNESINAYIMTK